MGDMGEMFREWDKVKKRRKANNKAFSTHLLEQMGIKFESKNGGVHLIVRHNDKVADFWPSTGKFTIRGTNKYSRGVNNLIQQLDK